MALLLLLPAFAGCLDSGEPAQPALAASVSMAPGELVGGTFQPVENKGNDYLIDRETQRTVSFTGIKSVPAQDFAVQDDQDGPRMDRRLEHLVSSDQAIIQVRRRLLRALRELREGQEPPEAHDGARYSVRSLDMELPKDVSIEDGGREYMTAKV